MFVLCVACVADPVRAQTGDSTNSWPRSFVTFSYRIPGGDPGSWGASIEFGRTVGDALIMGQFSYIVGQSKDYGTFYRPASTSSSQVGLAAAVLATGQWLMAGPQLGIVYGGMTSRNAQLGLNYGGCIKISFAAIPQTAHISVDYGHETGWGLGLMFPI